MPHLSPTRTPPAAASLLDDPSSRKTRLSCEAVSSRQPRGKRGLPPSALDRGETARLVLRAELAKALGPPLNYPVLFQIYAREEGAIDEELLGDIITRLSPVEAGGVLKQLVTTNFAIVSDMISQLEDQLEHDLDHLNLTAEGRATVEHAFLSILRRHYPDRIWNIEREPRDTAPAPNEDSKTNDSSPDA